MKCIRKLFSSNEFLHIIDLRKSIEKSYSRFFMPSCYDMRYGKKDWFVLPATTRASLTHSINTLSRISLLFLYNAYFSSFLFMTFRSLYSGFLRKRTWWWMQHHVMIIRNLLTWVCKYLKISLTRSSCAESCISYSKLSHSKYKTKSWQNPRVLRVLLLQISLHSLPSLRQNGIALACSTPLLRQTRYRKILPRGTQILPHSNR